MPAHVVYWARAVVHPVGHGRYLIKRPVLGYLFKCAVYVAYCGHARHYFLAIHLKDVLENAVGGRVRWAQIERCQLTLYAVDLYVCAAGGIKQIERGRFYDRWFFYHELAAKHGVYFVSAGGVFQWVLFAHGEVVHVIQIEDADKIWVVGELHPEEVIGFTLHPIG